MKRLALVTVPLVGCASLIGASFDDAHPPSDASADVLDAHEVLPDVAVDVPPPFVPSSIPGLAFWIDATHGVDVDGNGAVTTWHDQSTNHYDAKPAAQGTLPPTLVANALGGKPVVHFSSADPDLLATSFVGPGTAQISVFLVARGYAESALRFQSNVQTLPFFIFPLDLAGDAASPSFWLYANPGSGPFELFTGFDGGASVLETTWIGNGTAASFRDGTLIEQRAASPALPAGQTLYIGGVLPFVSRAYFTDGDVAEAIVYTSALDEGARRAVEGYLLDKWAISP